MFALASSSEIPCIFFPKLLVRRFGSLFLLAVSAAAVFIRLMLWALFPFRQVFIATQLLHSLCFGFYYPAAIDFIFRVFPPQQRGFGMPMFLALSSGLPYLIGNMARGIIVETAGYRPLFAIYAVVSGIAVLVHAILRKKAAEV
jgi:PPP family 3-phenylpropionic acid transporter